MFLISLRLSVFYLDFRDLCEWRVRRPHCQREAVNMEPAGDRRLPRPPLRQLHLILERRTHVQRSAAQIQVRGRTEIQLYLFAALHVASLWCFLYIKTTIAGVYKAAEEMPWVRGWRDRAALTCFLFCTIFRPDLIDMEVVSRQSNRENLEQAFEIAESLGVTRLLDAEGEWVDWLKKSSPPALLPIQPF